MKWLVFFFSFACAGLNVPLVQAQPAAAPATASAAQAVLDLSKKPFAEPLETPILNVAWQQFETKGSPEAVAKAIDAALVKLGLKQQAGAMFTEAYSAATYSKAGFNFSLGVMPSGKDGVARVTLSNLGNVDFKALPKVADAKEVFVQGASAIYSSGLSVDDARTKTRQILEAAGWQWFGETTASFFLRKNAVRLQVMCNASPDGKTMLMFSSEQMSTALPVIPGLTRIAYTEPFTRLEGDSPLELATFWTEYRKLLEAAGWKATTENPVDATVGKFLIFRSAAGELVELKAHQFEEFARFELRFQTAEQLRLEEERMKAKLKKGR
ncbi:MAG: hypothetical protein RIS70_2818 [Planctomycetota bacterium]